MLEKYFIAVKLNSIKKQVERGANVIIENKATFFKFFLLNVMLPSP
jgi:hypothetical protein